MSCQNDPEISRRADGTIDFAFYDARARRLRSEAILRSPSRMPALRTHGWPSVADKVMATTRSVIKTFATVRISMADKFLPG